MKITNLVIIFLIIVLPFNLVTYLKSGDMKASSIRNIELNRIIDTAIEDGTSALVEMSTNNKIIINKEKAVQTFFNSLYINFDVLGNSVLQRKINGYVPAIVIIDYDGYYVLSQDSYTKSDGYKEIKHVWKPKKMFSYTSGDYVFSFTLDNYVTVYDSIKKQFFQGDYHDLKSEVSSNIIQDDSLFEQVRRRIIVENIKNDLNYYINKHNEIAVKYGITYHFSLPTIKNEDWYKTISDIGMLVFFQGLQVNTSGERFNTFALGGARIIQAQKYYVDTDPVTGIKRYHKEDCPLLTSKDTVFYSRKESAKNGYLPCKVCKP